MAKKIYIARVPADTGVGKKFIKVGNTPKQVKNWAERETPNKALVYEANPYKKVVITQTKSETRKLENPDT